MQKSSASAPLDDARSATNAPSRTAVLDIPTVRLHNGVAMPLLQLGTAQLVFTPGEDVTVHSTFRGMLPERTYRQIQLALEQGMRAFDTAHIYRSQAAIGAVLGEWWRTGQLQSRQDVWLTSKIFHPNATHFGFGSTHMPQMHEMTPAEVTTETRRQFEQALIELGVGFVDLMLLHWPSGEGGTSDENRQRRLAAWRVLEDVYDKGWARAIGVSNFSQKHIKQLLQDGARVKPMVNQFQASIMLQYTDILEYCQQQGIVPQAYSPLGRSIHEMPPQVAEIASNYDKDLGQIAYRYLYQLGYAVTYLTNSERRMVSNTKIFDFELSDKDMQILNSLNEPDGSWGLPSPHDFE